MKQSFPSLKTVQKEIRTLNALKRQFKSMPWSENFEDKGGTYDILMCFQVDTRVGFERKATDPGKLALKENDEDEEKKKKFEEKKRKFQEAREEEIKSASEALKKSQSEGSALGAMVSPYYSP